MIHVILHARARSDQYPEQVFRWNRLTWQRELVPPDSLTQPLPVSFDAVVDNLKRIDRLYVEPDGSLLWTSDQGPGTWQIDGQLHDSAAGLMTAELRIDYAPEASAQIAQAFNQFVQQGLGMRPHQLVYQLVRPGVFVARIEF